MEPSSPGIRSRRSYPTLNQTSLAPLTPRFPIDTPDPPFTEDPQPQSRSYLSSRSVPGTPGLLSNSRSGSRTRHHSRSKSSTRPVPLETDPTSTPPADSPSPQIKKKSSRHHLDHLPRPDSEWMLRTGIALASSTREEKGQSWLEKRESSTSLVSDIHDADPTTAHIPRHHHHHRRSASGRKSHPRSGASTPGDGGGIPFARSRTASRRGSKAGLTMTGLDMTFSSRPSRSGIASPVNSDFGANMVDERIRDEIRRFREDMADAVGADYDGMSGTEDSDGFGSDEDGEEIDEIEMQRLTRERGFGLGRWIDRLVEWTLFGVEDLPAPSVQRQVVSARASRIVSPAQSRRGSRAVSVVEGGSEGNEGEEEGSDADTDITITREYDVPGIMEPPSETAGGWDDAWWLFSVMRKSLL